MRIQEFTKNYQQETYQFIFQIMIQDVKKESDKLKIELIPEETIYETYILSGGNFWIALDDNDNVIGTIGLKVNGNKSTLHRFYINASYRSCGIGSKLYQKLEQYASDSKVNEIYLSAGRHLTSAHSFYKKQGFQVIDDKDLNRSIKYVKKIKK